MMNKVSKRFVMLVAAMVVIGGCIYSGRVEYNDAVLSGMSADKYQYIHDRLNGHISVEDVVKEYKDNQFYYDSIFKE